MRKEIVSASAQLIPRAPLPIQLLKLDQKYLQTSHYQDIRPTFVQQIGALKKSPQNINEQEESKLDIPWEADFGENDYDEVVCEGCGDRIIRQFRDEHECREDIGSLFERLMVVRPVRVRRPLVPYEFGSEEDDDSDFEN